MAKTKTTIEQVKALTNTVKDMKKVDIEKLSLKELNSIGKCLVLATVDYKESFDSSTLKKLNIRLGWIEALIEAKEEDALEDILETPVKEVPPVKENIKSVASEKVKNTKVTNKQVNKQVPPPPAINEVAVTKIDKEEKKQPKKEEPPVIEYDIDFSNPKQGMIYRVTGEIDGTKGIEVDDLLIKIIYVNKDTDTLCFMDYDETFVTIASLKMFERGILKFKKPIKHTTGIYEIEIN